MLKGIPPHADIKGKRKVRMKRTILFAIVAALFVINAESAQSLSDEEYVKSRLATLRIAQYKFNRSISGTIIFISVERQELYLLKGKGLAAGYPVSTSKYGEGNLLNSEQTPLGFHEVDRLVGANAGKGAVINKHGVQRSYAKIYKSRVDLEDDYILSRAVLLRGLERGRNKDGRIDSARRGIYIHGTHEEGLIGSKASHGCIRMKNSDVIELFESIKCGTLVYIGY